MGRVFTFEQIKAGEIPKLSAFTTVTDKIRRDLEAMNGVIGAILFGSVSSGTHNLRSDVDCLVLYDDERQIEVFYFLQKIAKLAATLFVPTEIIPLGLQIAKGPMHTIEPPLIAPLEYAIKNGGLIKENPLRWIFLEHTSRLESVRSYLRRKLQKLQKDLVCLPALEGESLCFSLQKMLEAPVRIARKMLWLQGVEMPDDSKKTVALHYPKIATARACKLFAKITDVDSLYTKELLSQLEHPDKNQYSQTIGDLKGLFGDSLEFVRLNALKLA
ncbi:MAG: nucleotidyltransferase domain-containing protein [Patescibacteria group bacterium]|nr:nucleotidyltransferase domain-containing protein [Patescibacteria group bacterium]MDD4610684.1 nucleotidyltransferase domain-containing protein [Patescibacteria group bacterium]